MRRVTAVICMLTLGFAVVACSTESAPLGTSEPWDLIWFSDSTGWGVAELWAQQIEDRFDVEVRVRDHSEGGLSAVTVLRSLENEDSQVADWVAESEIVVFFGNPEGSGSTSDIGTCVTTSTAEREPPTQYQPEQWQPYRDVLDDVWDDIIALRDGRPTIYRAIDMYSPVVGPWEEAGILEECIDAWEAFSNVIAESAADHGVTMVSMFDRFNGTDHHEDPREKGYISVDGEHTTDLGKEALVEALDSAGYGVTP